MTEERKTFMVNWSLHTEADDPHDALRIALTELRSMLAEPSTGANRFTVFTGDDDESAIFIDADEVDEDDVWSFFQKPRP